MLRGELWQVKYANLAKGWAAGLLLLLNMSLFGQLYPDMDPQSELWGYRNDSGRWAIGPRYIAASVFADGHALVTLDEIKLISPSGEVYPAVHRVRGAKPWRPQLIIDTTGRTTCSLPVGYQADLFAIPAHGLLPLHNLQGEYGYIDTDGACGFPLGMPRHFLLEMV